MCSHGDGCVMWMQEDAAGGESSARAAAKDHSIKEGINIWTAAAKGDLDLVKRWIQYDEDYRTYVLLCIYCNNNNTSLFVYVVTIIINKKFVPFKVLLTLKH